MQKEITQMGEESINKLLFRFSLPSTISMGVLATYNLADTFFVGRLGSEALAALSLAFPLQLMLASVAIGGGVGTASLISRSLGAGNKREAETAVGQIMGLAIILGLAAAVLGYFFLDYVLMLFGAGPEIFDLTREYLLVITTGAVSVFLMMTLNHAVRSMGEPVFSMKVLITSALSNIALDPLLIYTAGLGVQGAAVATVTARFLGVLILLHFFLSGKAPLQLRFSDLRPRWYYVVQIYRIGFAGMLLPFSRNLSQVLANIILLAPFGHIPVAVLGVFFRLQMLVFMPSVGVGQGLLPLIGYNFGANNLYRVRETLIKGFSVMTLYITFISILFFAFPEFMMSVFSPDEEVITMGTHALRIMVVMFPVTGIHMASAFFFQAIGKSAPSLLMSLLREIMLFMPILLILSTTIGLTGVWVARPVSDFLASAISLLLISRELSRQGIPLKMPGRQHLKEANK